MGMGIVHMILDKLTVILFQELRILARVVVATP
jgi:hypothetical protein